MKTITIEEYNKKMDKVIKKYSTYDNIDEALVAILGEACKYRIVDKVNGYKMTPVELPSNPRKLKHHRKGIMLQEMHDFCDKTNKLYHGRV